MNRVRAAIVATVGRTAVVASVLLACPLLGATAPEDPVKAVKAILVQAGGIVRGEGTRSERLESLRVVARALMDTHTMGRRAIGAALAARPDGQQEEFLELFDGLIVRSYLQKLLFFRDPRFAFGTPVQDGEAIIVRTKILTKKDTFYVSYRMERAAGRWMATDIVVEGISLTSNYHDQFKSILERRSFEELLDLMRRKVRGLRERDRE